MSSGLVLYSGTRNASSWAMRAWLALVEAGVPFDEVIVDIRRPQRFANLAALATLAPTGSVPLLVTPEGTIFDSLAIMEYANDACAGRLLPADRISRGRARGFAAWQHGGLSRICAHVSFESAFYPRRRRLTEAEHAESARLFRATESMLTETGGPWLFGALSLADLALAPAAVRLTRHDVRLEDYPKTQAWTRDLLDRQAVRAWLKDAEGLPPIWHDDYLVTSAELTEWDDGRQMD